MHPHDHCVCVRVCASVCLCVFLRSTGRKRFQPDSELGKSKIIVSGGFASKGKCRRTTRIKLKFDIIFYYRPNVLLNSYGLADIKTPFSPVHDYVLHASTASMRSVEYFIYYEKSTWIKSLTPLDMAHTIVGDRDSYVIHRTLWR